MTLARLLGSGMYLVCFWDGFFIHPKFLARPVQFSVWRHGSCWCWSLQYTTPNHEQNEPTLSASSVFGRPPSGMWCCYIVLTSAHFFHGQSFQKLKHSHMNYSISMPNHTRAVLMWLPRLLPLLPALLAFQRLSSFLYRVDWVAQPPAVDPCSTKESKGFKRVFNGVLMNSISG